MATGKGHPHGLYPLFFTEMWERLGFYLMLGILLLYSMDTERGGLGFSQSVAGEIYGTYLAFVYFTPFLGGMIADRYLGFRRSVFIGGLLMAAGYFCLAYRSLPTFYSGLVLLCVGNGFFKPNISAMVGNLYQAGDARRDAGFNIFYMGINIGAAISALLSAPLRNLWNFNYAFAAAGVGLLIGTTVLVINWRKLAVADRHSEVDPEDVGMKKICLVILLPAAIFGILGYFLGKQIGFIEDSIGPVTFGFIIGMLPIIAYFLSLVIRANPEERPGLGALIPVYVAGGAFFMILHLSGGLMTVFAEHNTTREAPIPKAIDFYAQKAMPSYFINAGPEVPRPDERTLVLSDANGEAMYGSKIVNATLVASFEGDPGRGVQVLRKESWSDDERPFVCKVFPDANVEVEGEKDAHGHKTITVKVVPETAKAMHEVLFARAIGGQQVPVILVTEKTRAAVYANAGEQTSRLEPGEYLGLVNAEILTAFPNPLFVVMLTPLVVAFFAWRLRKGREVSTARKIFYGMVITVLALLIMAWGAYLGHDGAAKTSMLWLLIYYMVITTGELCLSPMGLSLVTKLAPKRLVGLMMGGWFLSTSIGNKLSGFISGLKPSTNMFLYLALAILVVAAFIFVLLPKLDRAIKKYGA